jgi:hypothetical protein
MYKVLLLALVLGLSFGCKKQTTEQPPCEDCEECVDERDRSSESMCVDIIVATCKRVAECQNKEPADCNRALFPMCVDFRFDTNRVADLYDECIPAIENGSCEEIASDVPECKSLVVD